MCFDLFQTSASEKVSFPEVLEGPVGFGNLRAACMTNLLLISRKSDIMVPSCDEQTVLEIIRTPNFGRR